MTQKRYYVCNEFLIQVLEITNNNNEVIRYVINLGAKEKGCVSIEASTKKQKIIPYNVAHIIYVKYDKSCNRSETLQSGTGTRHMITTALNITKKLCPWIDKFEFDDASAKLCTKNGPEISLSYLYIALYGKTWYEQHFDAVLKNEVHNEYYKKCLKKLRSKKFKEISPYTTINPLFNINLPKPCVTLYDNSSTLKDFFSRLLETYSKETICTILAPWLERFFRDVVFKDVNILSNKWVINHVQMLDVSLESIAETMYFAQGGSDGDMIIFMKG